MRPNRRMVIYFFWLETIFIVSLLMRNAYNASITG
jgi:hypothetical protein